jgi:hypothetical protein
MQTGGKHQNSTPEEPLPTLEHISGELAQIVRYVRANERCPTDEFFKGMDSRMVKKFKGQFTAITKKGESYSNDQRFTALRGYGKPLWEFKEFDHRLYCYRKVIPPSAVFLVLLSGWVKQKTGKTEKEQREIKRAMDLYEDFIKEQGGR